jgi:hypothetical protein
MTKKRKQKNCEIDILTYKCLSCGVTLQEIFNDKTRKTCGAQEEDARKGSQTPNAMEVNSTASRSSKPLEESSRLRNESSGARKGKARKK